MRDQLKALVNMARIDAKARGIDDRLAGLPRELEERRAALQRLEALVERQHQAIRDAERLLASQETDLATRAEAIAKTKSKGARATNMREADMAERELEAMRRAVKDGEQERERLKERIAKTRAGMTEPEKSLLEGRSELAAAEAALQGELDALRAERAKVVEGRATFASQIDKAIHRTYDRIAKGKPPVVCEIAQGTCSACRMAVAPQRVAQIMRGEILQCQACQRFLYHPTTIED